MCDSFQYFGNCTCDKVDQVCENLCECDRDCDGTSKQPYYVPDHPNYLQWKFCSSYVQNTSFGQAHDFSKGLLLDSQFCVKHNNNPSLSKQFNDWYSAKKSFPSGEDLTSEIDNAKLLATDNLKKIPNPFETYDTVDMSYYDYLVGDPLMNAGNIFSGWKVNAGFGHCEPGGILFGIPLEQRCYLTDIDASTFDSIISIWRINQEKFASYSPITVQQVFTPPDDDKVKLKFLLRAAGTISAAILERPQTFRAGIYNFIVEWNSLSQRDRTIRSTSPGYLIGTPVMINDPTMPPTIIDNMSCQKQNQLFINICSDPSGCIQEPILFGVNKRYIFPSTGSLANPFSISPSGNIQVSTYRVADTERQEDFISFDNFNINWNLDNTTIGVELEFLVENTGFAVNPQWRIIGIRQQYQQSDSHVQQYDRTLLDVRKFLSIQFNLRQDQKYSDKLYNPPIMPEFMSKIFKPIPAVYE